ncbi:MULTISPECIES: hypothetical protein [Helcococcus]|uniref:hypothetical protein n=1 Tax=Helcococcus TaxID=31983 RepID=UPI001070188B|nr:hypothetical protein [Helcococcus ovis]TFF68363.1 hypothetical protein EQF93_02690 [Helcococcus ovis]WNZ00882.1 hypothetical protein EQF90_006350 [Helcococcus ovis]
MPQNTIVRKAIKQKYFKNEEWEENFLQSSSELKRMSDYAGCSLFDLLNLPLPVFLLIKRDSWLDSMNKTEDGREVLKDLWRLGQTKADLTKVREKGVKQV